MYMDGLQGLSGWQWIFIIEAIPPLVLAFTTYFVLPDYPGSSHCKYPQLLCGIFIYRSTSPDTKRARNRCVSTQAGRGSGYPNRILLEAVLGRLSGLESVLLCHHELFGFDAHVQLEYVYAHDCA